MHISRHTGCLETLPSRLKNSNVGNPFHFVLSFSSLLLLIPETQSLSPLVFARGTWWLQTARWAHLYSQGWPLDCLVNCGKQTELFSTTFGFSREFFLIPLSCVLPKFLKYCSWRFFLLPALEPRYRNQASAAGITWLSLTDNSVFEQSSFL